MRILCIAKDSHILSTKNNSVFQIFMFEILNELLNNDIVNFEQLGPGEKAANLKFLSLFHNFKWKRQELYIHAIKRRTVS